MFMHRTVLFGLVVCAMLLPSALGAKPGSASAVLAFERPDRARFPCLGLAYEALRRGGTVPAILSAANEVAVESFVAGAIGFGEIAEVIEETLGSVTPQPLSLEGVRVADARAREVARGAAERRNAAARETVQRK